MAHAMTVIERDDWDDITRAFAAFFAGLGDVHVDGEQAAFTAEAAGTGLELNRDGTSRSFMPLHGLNLRWNSVSFDTQAMEVTLSAAGAEYTYRVPPSVIGSET